MAEKTIVVKWDGTSEAAELPVIEHEEPIPVPDFNELSSDQKFAVLADALRFVLEFCWTAPYGKTADVKRAAMRFAVVSLMLEPVVADGHNLSSFAAEFKTNPEFMSSIAREWRRKTGLKWPANHCGARFARNRPGRPKHRP